MRVGMDGHDVPGAGRLDFHDAEYHGPRLPGSQAGSWWHRMNGRLLRVTWPLSIDPDDKRRVVAEQVDGSDWLVTVQRDDRRGCLLVWLERDSRPHVPHGWKMLETALAAGEMISRHSLKYGELPPDLCFEGVWAGPERVMRLRLADSPV